jgi:hypothetical protein
MTTKLTAGTGPASSSPASATQSPAPGTVPLPPRPAAVEWLEATARALGQLRDGLVRQSAELADLRAERERLRQELAETRAQLAAAQAELGLREAFVAHTLELTSLVRMFELGKVEEPGAGTDSLQTPVAANPDETADAAPLPEALASTAPPPDADLPLATPSTAPLVWPGSSRPAAAPQGAERLPMTTMLRPFPTAPASVLLRQTGS